ncbi:hypothetical protein [Hymenobacter arizonensis]|uniref:Uncharacterized protein n=1 Tax=Hymenobacter arizonensis TaxID=1227077 RepID=A0A1I5Z266_HYMAR|nr:hypothetical protein [Hymenobacter arizonensis]SFQ50435.1 hypothetical protein SAMN04515668_2621 [Hymenobacter arizonensis]
MRPIGLNAQTTTSCYQLSLRHLRKLGGLEPGSPPLNLLWGGQHRLFISCEVLSEVAEPYLQVRYEWRGKPHSYWLELVPVVSPISYPYPARYLLVCPVSGLRTTTLYLHTDTGELMCRQAWGPGRLYYPSQLVTERARHSSRQQAEDDALEKVLIDRPRRKLWYKGKPTRPFAALLNLQKRLGYPPPVMDKSPKHSAWLEAFWKL